jgi:anthranilate synthase component 2
MFLLIDNFDSFTFNLVQVFQQIGVFPRVVRNDRPELLHMSKQEDLDGVVISPGPGGPLDSGSCLEFLSRLEPSVPVLGVCLGHQILGHFAGHEVRRAGRIMHGKTSQIHHDGEGLFSGLDSPFSATRYHSLLVDEASSRETGLAFKVTARSGQGELMGLCYQDRPWMGIQFHPESVLTVQGPQLLGNFVSLYLRRTGEPLATAGLQTA